MRKYTKVKVLRISEEQDITLKKMKALKVDVANFIRIAIKEKLDRDHKYLKAKKEVEYCPFSNGTIIINNT